MSNKRRPTLHVITIKKVKGSNTQISFTGHLTIDGQFGPHMLNKQTALFINNYEVANRFAALHLKELRKDQKWFWEYHIEELPFPHSKHIQIAQTHKTYLLEQLQKKQDAQVTVAEPVEIKVPEPAYQPRKKRVVIPQVFAIQATYGQPDAPFMGYLNIDFSVKSLILSKSTAVFLDKSLAERFLAHAQSQSQVSPDKNYSFEIKSILNSIQKAKSLAKFALPAINRQLSESESWRAFEIEVIGADPKSLPDNLAPLKNFTSREDHRYFLCTNLQITDHAYKRAYFDSEKIAQLFLKHVRPFLKVGYPRCKFKVKETELEPNQYKWVDVSMVAVKHALLTQIRPPKAPKPPRSTNKKPAQIILPDYYVVAIGDDTDRYFQRVESENDSLIISSLEDARWYDSEAVAIENANKLAERYQVTARAVLMQRDSEQPLAPIEKDNQFKLWLWQQEQSNMHMVV